MPFWAQGLVLGRWWYIAASMDSVPGIGGLKWQANLDARAFRIAPLRMPSRRALSGLRSPLSGEVGSNWGYCDSAW